MVRKSRVKFDNLSEKIDDSNGKKRGLGQQPLLLEKEDITVKWNVGRRIRILSVRRVNTQKFVLAMVPHFAGGC